MRLLLLLLAIIGILGGMVQFSLLVLNSTEILFGKVVVISLIQVLPLVIGAMVCSLASLGLYRTILFLTYRYSTTGFLSWMAAVLLGMVLGGSLGL